jgi:inositol oxygenase
MGHLALDVATKAVHGVQAKAPLQQQQQSQQGASHEELLYSDEQWQHPAMQQLLTNPKLHEPERRFQLPDVNAFGLSFRAYDAEAGSERQAGVEDLYRMNHIHQTFDFGQAMRQKHLQLNKVRMSIWECCELLNECVDDSDPDLEEPQIQHLLQTAEAIRLDHPEQDWFHLVGLIHDLGKVLLHPLFGAEPQYAVVGDTFPVGCAFDPAVVHAEWFKENPDSQIPEYSTKLGVYEENCGLDNVVMSWGHDEYMYQVMTLNNCSLPPAALFVIRYHSFYAMHHTGAYRHLMNESDHDNLRWLKEFNKYDLYSKSKAHVDVEAVKPYYQSLIQKYFPRVLRW